MIFRMKKHSTILRLLTALSLYIFLVPLGAVNSQDRSRTDNQRQREEVIRLETELVQIDLVVTGKDGKPVRDLRREDFELFEDGKKQQITHFAVGTSTQPASWISVEPNRKPGKETAGGVPVVSDAGRYIVLAIDDFHLDFQNLHFTKTALTKFVDQQMVSGDKVALVTTSGNVGLYQQFTSEREVLKRAIDRLTLQKRIVDTQFDIPRITEYQAELIDRGDRDALEIAALEILRIENPASAQPGPPSGGGGGGARGRAGQAGQGNQGGMSARERAEEQAKSKARMIVLQNANYTRASLETLDNVIRSLRPLVGRKMVILFSDGFFTGSNIANQAFDLQRITDAATRAGVVIYSIDARGLVATPPGMDATQPSTMSLDRPGVRERIELGAIEAKRDGLNALAYDTGGFMVINNNDLSFGMQRVLADNETYYVLAYEPPVSRKDGRFHKIEVRIADRDDLKVRTRKGYYAALEKETKAENRKSEKIKPAEKILQEVKEEKELQIRSGLASLFPLKQIPVEFATYFIETGEGSPTAMINIFFDASGLTFQQANGLHLDSLDLTVAIFNENGKVEYIHNDRLELKLQDKTHEYAITNGFTYRKSIKLNPGFYQARVAVREEHTARLGSGSSWVEIPDLTKNKLTLSSILLSESAEESGAQDSADQNVIRPATARRIFKRNGKIDFLVVTYNAKADKGLPDVVLQSQVYSGSKLVYSTPLTKLMIPEDTDYKRIPYVARVSLTGFDPGEYELRLVAVDRSNKATADRRVNFTVQ